MKAVVRVIIATAIALALAIILLGLTLDVQGEAPPSSQYDEQIKALERAALDEAFRQQAVHVYLTWMRDESGQPKRMQTGMAQARRAYIATATAIEQRGEQPPLPRPKPAIE